jgi:hypothetical protein
MKNGLDALMRDMGIFNPEDGSLPTSDEERYVIKIQLLAAQIIVDDVCKIKKISPNLKNDEIIDQLLHNWMENIRNFSSDLIESHYEKSPISVIAGSGQECC